jgi:hypothetical protein
MPDRVSVFVYAGDPVSEVGIAGQLRARPELRLVDENDVDRADVAVVVADEIDDDSTRVVRAVQRNGCPRVIMVVAHLDESGILAAVEASSGGRRASQRPSYVPSCRLPPETEGFRPIFLGDCSIGSA